MNDKIKEFRDNNAALDIVAGFIPGVGEAQDAHDFYHAFTNKDLGGMALASLGLVIPGVSASSISKIVKKLTRPLGDLSPTLKEKGWKITPDGEAFINPTGQKFRKHINGKLVSEENLVKEIEVEARKEKLKKTKNTFKKDIDVFNKQAQDFYHKTGLDFSLEHWSSLAKGHKMSDKEIQLYIKEAFPNFVKTYDNLIDKGLLRFNKSTKKWEAYFDQAVSDNINPNLPKLKEKWKKGYRELSNIEAMQYIIVNSPQAKDKFLYTGVSMFQGIPKGKIANFESGLDNQNYKKWFDSDVKGAIAYADKDGYQLYGLPIKPSVMNKNWDDKVRLIPRLTTKPSSNNWNGSSQSPIGQFLSPDATRTVNVSEGPLTDDLASKVTNSPVNGVFTIVGEDIPIKSIFGGSGMYDISKENLYKPFMSLLPFGLLGAYGLTKYEEKTDI